MRISQRVEKITAVTIVGLVVAAPSYAYLDPGSGSFLTQVVVASIVGGLVAFRSSLRRSLDWLRSRVSKRPKQ